MAAHSFRVASGVALFTVAAVTVVGCSAPRTGASAGSVAVAPAAVLTTAPSTGPATAPGRVITAHGLGKVTGTPDTVTITLGVQTQAASAAQALGSNNTKAAAVIAMLKEKGVAAAELQTSGLSIYPTYADKDNAITGYRVSNSITATLHGVKDAGAIIDAAQQAAGDAIRVDQLGFSIGDGSSLRAQARADAVKQAMAQAKQLADAAGVTLGQILSISEDQPQQAQPLMSDAAAAPAASGGSVPIEAGSQDLTMGVQVVYSIG